MELWIPESPFLEAGGATGEATPETHYSPSPEFQTPWSGSETPFMRDEYESESANAAEFESYMEMLEELKDETFEGAVHQLAARANDYLGDRMLPGATEAEAGHGEAERELEQYFAPLAAAATEYFDRVSNQVGRHDLTSYSEAELENMLNQESPTGENLAPEFEEFLGKLVRKAKGLVRGAVNLAKKGLSTIAKLGLGPVLKALGKMVRPLVNRIIQFAINRLPAGIRPLAQKLSRRLLGFETLETESIGEAEGEFENQLPNAIGAEAIQTEFDLQIMGLLATEAQPEAEAEAFESYETEQTEAEGNPGQLMAEAKDAFVAQFNQLAKGQDPTPAVQQFLPAALIALRPLIRPVFGLLGRPKVVNLLGGLIAKFIQRWVGPQESRMLGNALADTGLTLLGLEAPTGESPAGEAPASGAEMIAETLEATLLQVAQLPEAAFEDEVQLEAEARVAFEAAAAAYFPDATIRPELRETAANSGIWVPRPRNRRRKYFRKYSRVIEVQVTPQMAAGVRVFGGATLAEYFQNVLLIPPGRTVKAYAHLYELTIGARLVDIAVREKRVRGLGNASWRAWSQLQPLTPEAAGTLFREPGLGKRVAKRYLAGPYLTGIGQRFYYLQIPGVAAPVPVVPGGGGGVTPPPRRQCPNAISLRLNLAGARLVFRVQLSERTAQEIAQALRRRDIPGAFRILKSLDGMVRDAVRNHRVQIGVREFEQEQFAPLAAAGRALMAKVLQKLLDKAVDLLWQAMANTLRNLANDFIRAADAPADGVVVYAAYVNIPGLAQLRNFRSGGLRGLALPSLDLAIPRPSISIHAGCNK